MKNVSGIDLLLASVLMTAGMGLIVWRGRFYFSVNVTRVNVSFQIPEQDTIGSLRSAC